MEVFLDIIRIKVLKQFNNNIPLLDPLKEMRIDDENLEKLIEKEKKVVEQRNELEKKFDHDDLKVYIQILIQIKILS